MKKKVLVTRAVFDETLAYLAQHFDDRVQPGRREVFPDELGRQAPGMDAGVISSSRPRGRRVAVALPRREGASAASASVTTTSTSAACTRRGVMVTNTPGVLTNSVADFAVCLTLATCRRLTEGEASVAAREWEGTHLKQLLAWTCIMRRSASAASAASARSLPQRLQGFEPKILYYQPQPRVGRNRARAGGNLCEQGRPAAPGRHRHPDPALHAGGRTTTSARANWD